MGMPEYRDGNFGPIKPIRESVEDLLDPSGTELERTKTLHIGRFEELVGRAKRLPDEDEPEPLARILQGEFEQLRMDVNRIMIHLGIDDKSEVLAVKNMPKKGQA